MFKKYGFLIFLFLCPLFTVNAAEDNTPNDTKLASEISAQNTVDAASEKYSAAFTELENFYKDKVNAQTIADKKAEMEQKINAAKQNSCPDTSTQYDTRNEEQKAADLAEKQKAYDDAKANEQSTANKTLTALTTAATGIGGMELARGLSEQKADKDAANSMAAYIATMRCTYADGKQVKAGPDEIELPGGNNQQLMNLRNEYFALATDLKERKNALGMKPGIESEEILDKSQTGLYDDEMIGITSGAYESLYRAQMLGSEADQAKIDENAKTSKNRVIAGAVVGGVGVVGGIVGNSLINGKLGELIKKDKNCKSIEKLYKKTTDSLEKLKSCLKDGGASNTDGLSFDYFQADWLSLSGINCKNLNLNNDDAQSLFKDSNSLTDVNEIVDQLKKSFGADNTKTMLGAKSTEGADLQAALKTKIEKRASEYKDALYKDEKSGCNSSFLDGIKTGIIDAKSTS